jgi:hypothetical protein
LIISSIRLSFCDFQTFVTFAIAKFDQDSKNGEVVDFGGYYDISLFKKYLIQFFSIEKG